MGSRAGTWSAGPGFPNGDNAGDSFAVLEPSGNVLVFGASGALYEWNGKKFYQLRGPKGSPQSSWLPTIKSYPRRITAGKNYPLVRITLTASGNVFYARTHNHSTMSVATGSKPVWTYFDVPKGLPSGSGTLEVVANGIASKPVNVAVTKLSRSAPRR
jgi:hypothetical protein